MAIDIETSGLDWKKDRIATVQIADAHGHSHIVRVGVGIPHLICTLIADPTVRKIFHHAMFDLRFMSHAWGVRISNVACTKIASKLLCPRSDLHSLKHLLHRHLGVELDKREQLSDWFSESLSADQLLYAAGDVVYLHRLMDSMTADLRSRGLMELASDCFSHLKTRVELEVAEYPDVYVY